MNNLKEDNNKDLFDVLPNLPKLLHSNQLENSMYTTDKIPPIYSTTSAIVSEVTNSDPSLIRSTMYLAPVSEYLLVESAIPFSLILTPFNDNSIVSQVDVSERCESCRSFASKFTKNTNGGFFCAICDKPIVTSNKHILSCSTYDVNIKNCDIKKPIFTFVVDLNTGNLPLNAISAMEKTIENDAFNALYSQISFFILNGPNIYTFVEEGENFYVIKMYGNAAPKVQSNSILHKKENWRNAIFFVKNLKENIKELVDDHVIFNLLEEISLYGPINIALLTNRDSKYNYEEFLEKNKNICVNLFTTCNSKTNTLERLSFYSAGNIFIYKPNDIFIEADLMKVCSLKTVYNLSIKVRASGNIVKTDVIAPTLNANLGNMTLNSMNSSTSVMYNLSLSEPSIKSKVVQAEIGYIDFDGTKKIRILNLELNADKFIYTGLSFDAVFAAIVKLKLDEDININELLAKIFTTYRIKNGYKKESSMVMPSMLSALPVLFQAYNKLVDPDNKFLFSASVEQILRYFYPTLLCLSNYLTEPDGSALRLSKRNIFNGEIYFLENYREIIFFITKEVDLVLLENIFVDYKNLKKTFTVDSFNLNTEEGKLCNKIVTTLCSKYSFILKISVVYAGQHDEIKFSKYMIEDDMNGEGDYSSYIYKLHAEIKKRCGE